ncbi:hypothetical protein RIF29_27966 [Crotalaria pallida]|uniref:Uncharacterized protein n=1 Tax=Crotalaria pallida TaxID=3830 RepID=A0AAN9ES86_CROPI
MEYPFSPKGRGSGFWSLPREGSSSLDGRTSNSISDNIPNSFSELLNLDTYADLYNSPYTTDQILGNGLPLFASVPYQSPDGFNLVEQNSGKLYMTEVGGNYNATESLPSYGEKAVFKQMDTVLGFSDDANNLNSKQKVNVSSQYHNTLDKGNYLNPRSPPGFSLDERMLRALSFFKESAGGGILAQVWVPIKHGDQFILTTSEQPYLLDQMLAGYREVSRTYTFSVGKAGSSLGLPGRVFNSKVLEWTSNVGYYSKAEYLRVDHAINHEVRGSIAFPISDLHSELPCCAVLELVTTKEKPDFDRELELVCHALKLVNLRTTMPPRLIPQCLSNNKRAALTEIVDVLRSVCHAHRLPLALTWIPCCYTEGAGVEGTRIQIKEGHSSPSEKSILCIEESACYITDRAMEGFVHACIGHYLEGGKGIAGKALQSNHPFFYPDVKAYDISEYPLVQHARKYNLNAAVAIKLRSTYTNDDDYILEFFLPLNVRGSLEQQLLLDSLSGTMQKVCKSLRTVSDAELSGTEGSQTGFEKKNVLSFSPLSGRNSQIALENGNHDSVQKLSQEASSQRNSGIELSHKQETNELRRQVGKKRSSRSTSEKNVSLSVLQQYFSGSLKDAAKSIGVCPTTLKRICRNNGISRWPSRKIKKVNRSLKKIQTVLDSVQGVEGGLNFDLPKGAFVANNSLKLPDKSTIKDPGPTHDAVSIPLAPCSEGEKSSLKFEISNVHVMGKQLVHSPRQLKKTNDSSADCSEGSKSRATDYDFSLSAEKSKRSLTTDEMDIGVDGDDGVVELNHPSSSSLTDSSNNSSSMILSSSLGSQSIENKEHSKLKSTIVDSGSKIVVKATYREDTVRFKFDPSAGCFQLYEEIATRLTLQNGLFQLKYLDDEEEWVMLVNDSDLQECLDIMDETGTRSVKFLVRDMPCVLSGSGSSSCYLGGSS